MTAAVVAGAAMLTAWLLAAWAIAEPSLPQFASVLVFLGVWYVLAAAAIAYHSARAATGRDLPARLAAWSTAGRRGASADWGTAMRAELAGDRTGLLAAVLLGAPQLLFGGVALITARLAHSFRTGLEYGAAVLLASLLGILAVAIPESIRWYDEAGVWLLDGDYPASGIPNAQAAVQDALGGLTFFFLLFTTPWPVLGAYLGSHLRQGLPSPRA